MRQGTETLQECFTGSTHVAHAACIAGDMALLEQMKQLIPRLSYQQIQDNPFAEGATADVSEDAQDIVPLVIDAIVGFCHAQLCNFTSAFPHGTRMMKGAIEVMRIGLLSRGDPNGVAQVSDSVAPEPVTLPVSRVSTGQPMSICC